MITRSLCVLAAAAAIGSFSPVAPAAYADPPCRDNDNNGICDDF